MNVQSSSHLSNPSREEDVVLTINFFFPVRLLATNMWKEGAVPSRSAIRNNTLLSSHSDNFFCLFFLPLDQGRANSEAHERAGI
jgi:hypothetical protein